MSANVFGFALAAGAAVLALWILLRFANFGPRKIFWAVAQAAIACVLLQVLLPAAFNTIGASGVPAAIYFQIFGVALPLLVYAFLAGGWTMRLAMGLLR